MGEIEKLHDMPGIQPYERGIDAGPVVSGVLGRFLPASALSLAVVLYGLVGAPWGGVLGFSVAVLEFSGIMSLGYWLGLESMRRWLFPDAAVEGRRSIVAGLMSSFVIFILAALGVGVEPTEATFLLGFIGVAVAVIMFFAWLTPTPDREDTGMGRDGELLSLGSPDDQAGRDVL